MPKNTSMSDMMYRVNTLLNNKKRYIPEDYISECIKLLNEVEEILIENETYSLTALDENKLKQLINSIASG
jgi:hypothetical protein